ncbi:HD domain-containing protein [Prevotella copri]|uniref:HD domain-containing protein n=2 Tax=Segatella copri TaxID=165179 RepID=A0A6I2TS41_9BACT|nr:HD domain-containing protein [Segatella copri]
MNDKNEKTMNEKYEKKIQADVDVIFTLMAKRVDEKQMNLLHEAYNFAAYVHKDQQRKSGDPYISHPVAVARIVAEELELGASPVIYTTKRFYNLLSDRNMNIM